MAILTVSRQLGSLGTEISRLVADKLGYRYLDKDTFSRELAEYGVEKVKIDKFDERKPTLWDTFSTDRDRFLHFMKSVVYRFVTDGSGVVVGRGGQVLLRGLPGSLNIRIRAPFSLRVDRIRDRHGCSSRDAEKVLRESDIDRSGFHKFFFNANWENRDLYDLVLNTETMSISTVVNMIVGAVKMPEFRKKAKEAAYCLKNLVLGQEVESKILYSEKIPIQYLEARVSDGIVTLRGAVTSQPIIDLCEETAKTVEGVREVVNEISLINYYGMM